MSRKGRNFEKLVTSLEKVITNTNIEIKSPDYILGKISKENREIDISLINKIDNSLIIIECRERDKNKQGVEWIEQIVTKGLDVCADKIIIVSSKPFSKAAINTANYFNIDIRTFEDLKIDELFSWFKNDKITVFERKSKIIKVKMMLYSNNPNTKINFSKKINKYLNPIFDRKAKIFLNKITKNYNNFDEIWKTNTFSIFNDIPMDQVINKNIFLGFPNNNDRFQIKTTNGFMDIIEFQVNVDLWIELNFYQINKKKIYKNERDILSETIEFKKNNNENELSVFLSMDKSTSNLSINLIGDDI